MREIHISTKRWTKSCYHLGCMKRLVENAKKTSYQLDVSDVDQCVLFRRLVCFVGWWEWWEE